MGLAPGTRLGAYEIVAPLGAGGMGEVYRARDSKLPREVAVKILPAAVAGDPERAARFEREAHAVASLSHPNILAIHDYGSDRGVTYAVMELIDGQTLRETIAAGALPPRKAIDLAIQMARGLDGAHARGIVHRDLKPANVIVTLGGHLKILDFGLSVTRPVDAASAQTQTGLGGTRAGSILGTPGYMSPEQVRGEAVDHRSDIFSFGCVLYELLSGRRAFDGESSVEAMHATLRSEPRDLAALANVPAPLSRLVARCLEKAPAARFQSARDLVFALEGLGDAPAAAVPARARRYAIVGFACVAIAIAVMTGWMVWTARTTGVTPSPAVTAEGPRGIAVLPFENLGGGDQAFFAAGVTEEVTLQLAKISALRVISRNAVARFKGGAADLPAMARELKIGAILTGSVRHAGDQVRVGVQLIAAPSGETLWSEQYDGDGRNIFGVQSEVAMLVARSLQASLAPDERARIERPPTEVPRAYELFLKARPLSLSNVKQNEEAIALLQEAVTLDPKFALGYAMLARRHTFRGNVTGRAAYAEALQLARTAVALDPQLARAQYALGTSLISNGDIDEARLAMQRAIELDANYWAALADFAFLETNAGRLDQSVYWARRAVPLAPNVGHSYYHLGTPLMLLDAAAAEPWLQAIAARFPAADGNGGERIQALLAFLDAQRGRVDAALTRMRATAASQPDNGEIDIIVTELAFLAGSGDATSRVDRALAAGPGARLWWLPYTPRTIRAFLSLRSGQPARARPLINSALAANRKALDEKDRSPGPPYENAALSLMNGDRAAALDWLDRAVTAGFRDAGMLRRDPLLASLAGEARFRQILDRIDREIQDMRARADLRDLPR